MISRNRMWCAEQYPRYPECKQGVMISRNTNGERVTQNSKIERYPRYPQTPGSDDIPEQNVVCQAISAISLNANREWWYPGTQMVSEWCKIYYDALSKIRYSKSNVFLCWCMCTCILKILVQLMTQTKIADASKTHQKLVPVRIRGVPVCVRGVRLKNSHMGRRITHNEIVQSTNNVIHFICWRIHDLSSAVDAW